MRHFVGLVSTVLAVCAAMQAQAADTYKVDPVHTSVVFRVGHAGIGVVYGVFREASGSITLDDLDPAKTSLDLQVNTGSVDTRIEKRDAHLRSADFLETQEYPAATFKSTSVKKVSDARLEVTGDFTLHGQTRPMTVNVDLTGKGEFPKGTSRIGLETVFDLKQSDYKIKGLPGGVADEVRLMVAIEATK